MKKNILAISALMAFAGMQAQIQTNNGTVNGITNSNVLLDGSSGFSIETGAGPYVGKGIIIPSVDLVNFQFDLTLADGFTFPTYFDGMIVYNNATGNTLTTGNRPSASLAVTPGFYYFSNPNGANNGNVTAGEWKPLGGGGYEQDLRKVGLSNHITSDAGVGSNGTSVGTGYNNIAVGPNGMASNTTGSNNIAMGGSALASNTTGYDNVALGRGALASNTEGFGNIASGESALTSNTKGNVNVAVGLGALKDNTTGTVNTAVGGSALRYNTTANYNSAFGYSALYYNTTGENNVASGSYALQYNTTGNYNVASGRDALHSNTTGERNLASGSYALFNNTTGNDNIAIGYYAANGLIAGDGNIFLGPRTGFSTNITVSNQLFIGNAPGDNALIRGDFSTKVLTINNTLKVADLKSTAVATTGNRPVVADANGQLMIGTAPTILKGSGTISPATIDRGDTVERTITLTGAVSGVAYASPRVSLANGIVIAYVRISAPDTITIGLQNNLGNGNTQTVPATTFDVVVL